MSEPDYHDCEHKRDNERLRSLLRECEPAVYAQHMDALGTRIAKPATLLARVRAALAGEPATEPAKTAVQPSAATENPEAMYSPVAREGHAGASARQIDVAAGAPPSACNHFPGQSTCEWCGAVQPERCCLDYPRCDCNSPPEPDDDWLCFQRPAQPKVTP